MDLTLWNEIILYLHLAKMAEISEWSGNFEADYKAHWEDLTNWSERANLPLPDKVIEDMHRRLEIYCDEIL